MITWSWLTKTRFQIHPNATHDSSSDYLAQWKLLMPNTWPFWLTVCFVLACDLGTYMQPLLHDSVSWLLDLFCISKKQFKHLVSSSGVCSLNWLQALLFLLVGLTFFLRFARLQKPRIKLIVSFKNAMMTCDLGLCKSHLLSWWILHERKSNTWILFPRVLTFPWKWWEKREGKNCHLYHLLQNQILDEFWFCFYLVVRWK